MTPQKLPMWKKIMYALGQFGWSLTSFSVGNLLVYFYLPPKTGAATFPPYVFQGAIVGVLTIIGLAAATGRLFDAVTDPLIAGLSDRSKSSFGRRRKFLSIAIVPFSLFSVLTFMPITDEASMINSVWLFISIIIFYWFMTMYVTPFFAWMSELGHNPNERLLLSTMISMTWAFGAAVGSQAYTFQDIFEKGGMDPTSALQTTVIIFAVLGFILMLLPIIFIDESKYCEKHVSSEGIFEAVRSAFKNRNFLVFTLSDLAYWVSITCIMTGLVYYVTVLLGQQKQVASQLQIMLFGLSFVFYVPVHFIAKKTGKKKLLLFAFVMFAVTFFYIFGLGKIPLVPVHLQGYVLVAIAAIPLAIFGILPNAMIADIAEADGIEKGNFKAGIFFGARTFMSKLGQAMAMILFPSLLLLGREPGNDLGVRLTAIAALLFVVLGLILLMLYREGEIMASLAKKEELSPEDLAKIEEEMSK